MIEHYTPLITSIKTMFGYKTTSLIGVSLVTSITIEGIVGVLDSSFLGVPVILTAIVSLFILLDWAFGTAASRKIAEKAKKDGDNKLYEEKKFKSTKIIHTFFKFISLFLWLLLSFAVNKHLLNVKFLASFFDIITVIPVLLFGFREFISIGEDLESLYGTKYYLFELGEKIFDVLQLKFLKKIGD